GAADGLGTYKVDASNNVSRVADWYMTNPAVNGDKLNFIEYEYNGDQPILEWDGINDPETLPYQTDNYQTTGAFCKLGDKFIVTAKHKTAGVGKELYLYDPTDASGPQLLLDINLTGDGNPDDFIVVGDKVFFKSTQSFFDWTHVPKFWSESDLYETDGTITGTVKVETVNSAIDKLNMDILGELNGKLLLSASVDGDAELCSYDPVAGTFTTLSDIPSNGAASTGMFFDTNNILDGWIYYGGGHLPTGAIYADRYLYRTNGTDVELLDTVASAVSEVAIYNSKVYFKALMPGVSKLADGTLGTSGFELMVYDPNSLISNNAFLADLTIAATTIDGFDKYNTKYEMALPEGTPAPEISGVAEDAANATLAITQASFPGTATIVVTAEDGTTSNTYTVEFRIASTVSSLSDLTIDGTQVDGFSTETLIYNVVLPADHSADLIPAVVGTATDENATVAVTDPAAIPGTTTIVVTAEDGTTTSTYTINFTIAPPSTVSSLSDLTIDGVQVDGFSTETLIYNVVLPADHSADLIPVVVGTATDENASVEVTNPDAIPGTTTIVVTAEDGTTETTYTIEFRAASTVSSLSDLTIDDVQVDDFDAATLTYFVDLPSGHSTDLIPVVVGIPTDENATVVVNNPDAIPDITTVVVTAEDGTTETTYSIVFTIAPTAVYELESNSNFKVYPTVSNKHFNVELGQKGGSVKVFNTLGEMVLSKTFYNSEAQINIEQNGMYLMLISNGTKKATFKIFKN
ncbi:MAG: T9SS type A sorting domain-containing protein, partial [Bacteroidota bacterium]